MTTSDKLREFCENWRSDLIKHGGIPEMLSDLTALISEGYVTKEKYMDDLCDEYQRGFEDGMDEARNTDRL